MAHGYSRRGDRTRSRIYVISAMLIISLVIAYIYGGYPFGPKGAVATSTGVDKLMTLPAVKPAAEPDLLKFVQPTAKDNPQAAELITEAMSYIEAKPAG